MNKPKLIIHETDSHGCGYVYYNGKCDRYCYDDGAWGDVRATVQELVNIGFISMDDVVFLDDDAEMYALIEKGLNLDD
jgi:hypothetical protein